MNDRPGVAFLAGNALLYCCVGLVLREEWLTFR